MMFVGSLMESLNNHQNPLSPICDDTPVVGMKCAARCTADDFIYRAVIEAVENDNAKVQIVGSH